MDTKKRDEAAALAAEPAKKEAAEGAARLRLSVVRMKKLHSKLRGGFEEASDGGSASSPGNRW